MLKYVKGRVPQVAAGENPLDEVTDNNQGHEITSEWNITRRRFTPTIPFRDKRYGCVLGLEPRGDSSTLSSLTKL